VTAQEPVWIRREAFLIAHAHSLRLFGGAEGIRDEGALDSALMRPVNVWSYTGKTSRPALAAGFASGLAKDHPFVDGNKRAAFLACVGFLKLNGLSLVAPQPEAYRQMMALAAGAISEKTFAEWLSGHVAPRAAR
jgi:death-on-curing protein